MKRTGAFWSPVSRHRLALTTVVLLILAAFLLAACGGTSVQRVTPTAPPAVQAAPTAAAKPAAPTAAPAAAAPTVAAPAATQQPAAVAPAVKQVTSPYPARKDQINIAMAGTAPEMAIFAFTVALGKQVTENSGGKVNVTVSSAGGSPDSLRKLVAGDIHITTISLGTDAYWMSTGTGDFAGKPPVTQLRSLFSWASVPNMLSVRKDRNINTLKDLNGKKFATGRAGSASEKTIKALLDENGIKFEKYSGGVEDISRATQDGEIVGWNQTGPSLTAPDGNILSINAVVPLRWLTMTPEEQKLWREKRPEHPLGTVPPNVYPGQDYPVVAIVFVTAASALKDLPEDVAYAVTQAVVQDQQKIAASFKPLSGTNVINLSLEALTIPLHKGAARYYQDIGVTIPDKLKPID